MKTFEQHTEDSNRVLELEERIKILEDGIRKRDEIIFLSCIYNTFQFMKYAENIEYCNIDFIRRTVGLDRDDNQKTKVDFNRPLIRKMIDELGKDVL